MADTNCSTSQKPREWKPTSQRWRQQFEILAKIDDCELVKVGNIVFGKDKKFHIAKGSDGTEVYLGLMDDGTEVAVKRIVRHFSALKNENEIKLLSLPKLKHPSIVKYVDYAEDKDFGYLALELCEYTLEEYMRDHNPSERERKRLAYQVLQSLKVLHCQNPRIIHSDIKPQNVFIDIEGRARLADFGISLELKEGDSSIRTSPAGTTSWMAKETLLEDGSVIYQRSTDIQVAGMLIHCILSGGEHPFGTGIHIEPNILDGIYNLDRIQDQAAKNLIERMINEDPKKRPNVVECLAHPFWSTERSLHHRAESLKRDQSKGELPVFSEPGPPHAKRFRYRRAESPTPSCGSMESDMSMGRHPTFSEPGSPHTQSVDHRAESPTPSCVSMKSDWSMGEPSVFSEPGSPHTQSLHHRAESPTPSCVSMKSDSYKDSSFSDEPGPPCHDRLRSWLKIGERRHGLSDLRIVLTGWCGSGKSSAGNTILGGSAFKVSQTGQRSAHSEVKQGNAAGRHVTVVESPGWYYNRQLQDTSEMDKLEIQNSVSLCPPGPHAVLLTVSLREAFTKAQRVAVEEHMSLQPEGMWSYSMILFTCGDLLGDRSIEQHIEAEGEDLRWLLDKCGKRYHVLNNQKTDVTQVTQLLEKIEDMVSGNTGGHYEDDGDEKMSERKRNIQERVHTFMTKTHRQRTALKALFEGEHQSLADVRLMLVGGKQAVRSRAGNLILQEFKTQTKLTQCVRQQSRVAGRTVSVVNCPDWSTTPPSQKIKDVLLHGVTLCSPGPHAVLVNVPVWSRFSEADRRSVEEHMELLGDRVWRHALVLFIEGWWLGGRRVEEYIESEGQPLRWLLEKCGYRYHVLDGSKRDISEVTYLMEKTEDMVMRNRGHFGPSRLKTLIERLKGKKTVTENDWRKREQEIIERMMRYVVTEPEEPTLPAVRRRNSMDLLPPSMSGGTHFMGVGTMSEAPSQADADSVVKDPVESTLPAVRRRNSIELIPPSMSGETRSSQFDAMSDVTSLADIDETRPMTLLERLTGRRTVTAEEWKKREEQVIERMLKFVMMDPQEPMSGSSEAESLCWSPAKVSDWLTKHHGPIAPSSGYDSTSIAPTQADFDVMSERDEDVS